MGVVDGEHEGPVPGEVRDQPEQPVQGGLGGGAVDRGALRQPKIAAARRPGRRIDAPWPWRDRPEHRPEQLAHDAEAEVPLHLGAPRPQHPVAARPRSPSSWPISLVFPTPGGPSISSAPPLPSLCVCSSTLAIAASSPSRSRKVTLSSLWRSLFPDTRASYFANGAVPTTQLT